MKEIHFYSNLDYVPADLKDSVVYSYEDTANYILEGAENINTVQIALLSFDLQSEFGYDIYIHDYYCPIGYLISYDERQCERSEKELRLSHNILKMWRAGEFNKQVKKLNDSANFKFGVHCDIIPNKYNLTPETIKELKILDWEKLKKCTFFNEAMKKEGNWYCHLEGCQEDNKPYLEEDEFWIGFDEDNNKIDYHYSAYEGMCRYTFNKFYDKTDIQNKYDLMVQSNSLKYLNMLIDESILEI